MSECRAPTPRGGEIEEPVRIRERGPWRGMFLTTEGHFKKEVKCPPTGRWLVNEELIF